MNIGEYNTLKVARKVDFGVYLDAGEDGEVLMPNRYVPEGCEIGDLVTVFVYTDSEDRPVATTEKPLVTAGNIAVLKVKDVTGMGAFLEWGVLKDLLLPFSEQTRPVHVGQNVVVYVYKDNKSKRMAATMRWERHADYEPNPNEILPGDECEIVVSGRTNLGYKVLVDGRYYGLIFHNEVFTQLRPGEKRKGYIRNVRSDGKLDISLSPIGFLRKIEGDCDKVLEIVKQNGGFMPTTDKTPSEEIYEIYGLSKKAYKQAVGGLYKKRLIAISEKGISLN